MSRFNDFIELEEKHNQYVDDILTFDSYTADVYRVTVAEGSGFDVELGDEQLYKRILVKLGRVGTDGNRIRYVGLCADNDVQIDDILLIKGERYIVKNLDRTQVRTELDLIKQI
jgi:hypothetical protein